MSHCIKVAELDELPPGRGKTIDVNGRQVTVFNREGRFVATASPSRLGQPDVASTACDMPGRKFPVGLETTPDRLMSDELHYHVYTDEESIYVLVEEGFAVPGEEPRSVSQLPGSRPRRRKR